MTLQKFLGWNKLVATAVLSLVFVVAGQLLFTQTAHAAPKYTWDDQYHVKVFSFDHPQNSGDNPNFYFTCSGVTSKYTCVAPRDYNQGNNPSDKYQAQAGHCPPELTFSGDSSKAVLQLYNWRLVNNSYVCTALNPTTTVGVGDTNKAPGFLPDQSPKKGDTTPHDPELECGTPWSDILWSLCPPTQQLKTLAGQLDLLIYNMLTVDANKIFDVKTPTGKGFHTAWQSVAYLAAGLLVISALIMIISHALGFEILDAYTIKKVLPRLFIAIIGMTLSWELMKWFVIFTNDLGLGIRQMMWYPFQDLSASVQWGPGTTTSVIAVLLGLGAFAALGIVGLLSLAFTAVLTMGLALLVLVLRQVIIVVLIVFAPLAIAASVLPNTRKIFDFWWDVFSRLLIMFPIIIALITMGRIFAVTSLGTDAGKALFISQFIAYAAIVVTYFMILWAFQFAGKVGATLAGIANDRSRGIFDRLKKGRGQRVNENVARMKAGTRFNNRFANAATARGTTTGFGFGKKGRAALEQKNTLAAMEYGKSPKGQAIQHNDRALQAMTYGSAAAARANMARDFGFENDPEAARIVSESIAQARAAGGFGRANQVYAAQQLSSTGTGYDNLEQVSSTIARAANGNSNAVHAMAGFINSDTKQRGRHDLAPGFATLDQLAMDELNKGPGQLTPAEQQTRAINYGKARENAWGSASLYAHGQDKKKNIDNAINYHSQLLTSTDYKQRERAGVFFNELKAMQPNASGDVRGSIQEALDDHRDKIDELYMKGSATYLEDSDDVTVRVKDPVTGVTSMRAETGRERVERRSRTYERPDPNVL